MTDQELIEKMAAFFLQESNNNYDDAATAITKLRIHRVTMVDDKATIHCERPGYLIGIKGSRIDALTQFLGVNVHLVKHPGLEGEGKLLSAVYQS